MNRKGFTLIELLVVIAILAVLAVAVTLILNPAELVRQGRDSTRLSDIGTVHRAIGLYFADQQELRLPPALPARRPVLLIARPLV